MKSLEKALKLLNVFIDENVDSIRLADLNRLSGLNKLTVIRVVAVLVKYGYLYQPEKRGKYHLGPSFASFNRIISQKQQLRQIAMPHLNKLANVAKECVVLTVLDDNQAFVTEVIDSRHVLRTTLTVGVYIPLYCTGQGKAILAYMTDSEIDLYLNSVTLKRFGKNTITDVVELKSHLKTIRREDVSYDNGEEYRGIHNVASGIKNVEGKVFASVGVIGPAIRLTQVKMKELAPEIKQCALGISRDLGCRSRDLIKRRNKNG